MPKNSGVKVTSRGGRPERREAIWPNESCRKALRRAWKTLSASARRTCLEVDEPSIVETFACGKRLLLARCQQEGYAESAETRLRKIGALETVLNITELSNRRLRAPEEWSEKSDLPAILLRHMPRNYAEYQSVLLRQVCQLAKVCLWTEVWGDQAEEDMCNFITRSFYVKIYFQILSGPDSLPSFSSCIVPPPSEGRKARLTKIQQAGELAVRLKHVNQKYVLHAWKLASTDQRVARESFTRWRAAAQKSSNQKSGVSRVLQAWRNVTRYKAACRRLDEFLAAHPGVMSDASCGPVLMPPGFVLCVKNTFLECDMRGHDM